MENLLAVYKKYKQLIQDIFKGDQNFMGALDKACSSVINYRNNQGRSPCRSPELLAKYCDTLLKKSSKGISESEVIYTGNGLNKSPNLIISSNK